jgi:hypothetical protein
MGTAWATFFPYHPVANSRTVTLIFSNPGNGIHAFDGNSHPALLLKFDGRPCTLPSSFLILLKVLNGIRHIMNRTLAYSFCLAAGLLTACSQKAQVNEDLIADNFVVIGYVPGFRGEIDETTIDPNKLWRGWKILVPIPSISGN